MPAKDPLIGWNMRQINETFTSIMPFVDMAVSDGLRERP